MEEVINTLLSFSNDNILLISLMFILLSNIVVPGSLIIIFYITTLGFFKGILASYLVLTIANKSILFIRFTFIPFVVQNILCSLVAVSFLRFIALNLIGLTPSILLIAFFTESILQLRTNLLLISISLFLILGFFFHKSYKSYMRN